MFDSASSNSELTYDSRNRLIQGVLQNGGHISVAGYEVDLYGILTETFGYDAEDYRMYGSDTTGMSVFGLEGVTIDTLYSMYESLSVQLENKALTRDIEALDLDEQTILPDELTEDTEESTEAVKDEVTDEAESDTAEDSAEDAQTEDFEETNDELTTDENVPEEPVIEESVDEVPEVEDEAIEGGISEEPSNTSDVVMESLEEEPKEANIEESVSGDDIVTEIEAESDILLTDVSGDEFMPEQQLLDSLMLQSIGEGVEIQEATTVSEEDLWKLEMLEQLIASQQEVSFSNEYCYDRENKNLLVRFSSDGTIEKYVYGNGLIASYEAKPTEETTTTEYKTYIYDIRGSVTEVANVTGNVTAEYRYSTYGDRNIISGTEFDELGYCARDGVLTEASGLLYMRARYYYPTLMRFINEDIVTGDISNSASLNRYTYVEGNPVTLIDPFGLCAKKGDNQSVKSDFRLSQRGLDVLKGIELSDGSRKRLSDSNGGIYPYYAHDGGITFGYGHYVSEAEYKTDEKESELVDKYFAKKPKFTDEHEGQDYPACPIIECERTMSLSEAEMLLSNDVQRFEKDANKFIARKNLDITQNQFDAIVIHIFNHGSVSHKFEELIVSSDIDLWVEEFTVKGKIKDSYQKLINIYFYGDYE